MKRALSLVMMLLLSAVFVCLPCRAEEVLAAAANLCPVRTDGLNFNGISFTSNGDGTYLINGVSKESVNYNLYYNNAAMPEGLKAGGAYHLDYTDTSRTSNLRICMYYFDESKTDKYEFLNTYKSTYFIIPKEAVGLLIRISVVSANVTIDNAVIYPVITEIKGIGGQEEKLAVNQAGLCPVQTSIKTVNGVTFVSQNDGSYLVKGTSEKSANYNIYYNRMALPIGMEAGGSYYLKYKDTSGTNAVHFCMYYYDVNGSAEKLLLDTYHPIYFTIPKEAAGLLIRISVVSANVTIDNAVVCPVITVAENDGENGVTPFVNLAGLCPVQTSDKTVSGVSFASYGNGSYLVSGTSEKAANYNLYYSKTALPEGLEAGGFYHLEYTDASGTNDLHICMYYYDADGSAENLFLDTYHSIYFTIPKEAVGLLIRIRVGSANVTMNDALVCPAISAAENDGGFVNLAGLCPIQASDKKVYGVSFASRGDGSYLVSGTSEKAANYNLYYNKTALPEGLETGGFYHLEYTDASGTNDLHICMYYYDADGNAENLFLDTYHSIFFTIPKDAVGLLIRIRVVSANVTIDDAVVCPVITAAEKDGKSGETSFVNLAGLCPIQTFDKTVNGVSFASHGDGSYLVSGTSEKTANYNLYYNKTALPEGLEAGGYYHLEYTDASGTNAVRICMYNYDAEGSAEKLFLDTYQSAYFAIPKETVGLLIRIRIGAANVTIDDAVLCPVITVAENNGEYDEKPAFNPAGLCPVQAKDKTLNGITFTSHGDGSYLVNGTSEKGTNYNLYYNKTSLPDGMDAGKTYRLEYTDTSITENLRVCIAWYDETGEKEYDLFNTFYSINFTIPAEAKGLLIRLRVMWANVTIENAVVKPIITAVEEVSAPPPMLTIIDDDGCYRYYTDLFPLCVEKGISIATAVVPVQIEDRENGTTHFWMSWDEILECQANGIEVLSHTYDHVSTDIVETRSLEEITYTYQLAKQILLSHGISTNILIYSGDSGSLAKCHVAASEVYEFGLRAGGDVDNYLGTTDPYNIRRYKIHNTYDAEFLKSLISQLASQETGWMVWMIHTSNSQWGPQFLEALSESIDYAAEIGIPIVTTAEGAAAYKWN